MSSIFISGVYAYILVKLCFSTSYDTWRIEYGVPRRPRSSDDWGAGWSGDSPSPKKQTTAEVKKVSKKPKKASAAAAAAANDDNLLIDFGDDSSAAAAAAAAAARKSSKKAEAEDDDGWGKSLEDEAWDSLNN